jgi:hypothetical protein
MAGLDPHIHHSSQESFERMDGRVKPGNDDNMSFPRKRGPIRSVVSDAEGTRDLRKQLTN